MPAEPNELYCRHRASVRRSVRASLDDSAVRRLLTLVRSSSVSFFAAGQEDDSRPMRK
ncbi:hypothetical protein T4A_12581 [Trichinella pseudospiralis]|uniref:Uncharacterized protein n=1 Tax=Trichinella pseudospiralis TaxID=6337 RepID=A0A0V1EES1_TRIPS|nr:hypothetical protein T4A_12581 [Trichinella pseudospiralis]